MHDMYSYTATLHKLNNVQIMYVCACAMHVTSKWVGSAMCDSDMRLVAVEA